MHFAYWADILSAVKRMVQIENFLKPANSKGYLRERMQIQLSTSHIGQGKNEAATGHWQSLALNRNPRPPNKPVALLGEKR